MAPANLLSTLQGLTQPSREVDADVFQLLGGSEWDNAYMRAQEPCGCPHELAVSTARERYSPHFTASLDATIALCERVLPGANRTIRKRFRTTNGLIDGHVYDAHISGGDVCEGATEPIALLIAILRAKGAREDG